MLQGQVSGAQMPADGERSRAADHTLPGHRGGRCSWMSQATGWPADEGAWVVLGTHHGRWLPSRHNADQCEVLGLVAAEGGGCVRGHHFDGGGRSCQREAQETQAELEDPAELADGQGLW